MGTPNPLRLLHQYSRRRQSDCIRWVHGKYFKQNQTTRFPYYEAIFVVVVNMYEVFQMSEWFEIIENGLFYCYITPLTI